MLVSTVTGQQGASLMFYTVCLAELFYSHVVDGAGNGDSGPVLRQHRDVCGSLRVSEWCDVVVLSIMGNISADHRPHTLSKLQLNQSMCLLMADGMVMC